MTLTFRKLNFSLFLLLLIFMPMHYLVLSCLLRDYKLLSMWRDIIIIYLFGTSIRPRVKAAFPDISIFLTISIILVYALLNFSFPVLNIARTYCVPLLIYFYTRNISFTEKEIKTILKTSWAVSVAISIWGMVQAFLLGSDIMFKIGYGDGVSSFMSASFYINHWAGQQRVVGTFSSPNGCGAFFAIMILFLIIYSHYIKKYRAIYFSGIGIIACGLVTTFSRSAWVGCVAGIVIYLVCIKKEFINYLGTFKAKKNGLTILTLGILVAVVLLVILMNTELGTKIFNMVFSHLFRTITGQDASFNRHLEELVTPIADIINQPLGLGFGRNGSFATSYLPVEKVNFVESSFWVIAYEIGVIGLLVYFSTYIYGIVKNWKYRKNTPVIATAMILICTLLVYLMLPSVQAYEQPFYCMMFLGLSQNCIDQLKKETVKR